MKIAERIERIEAEAVGSDLNSWEKHTFLPSIKTQSYLTDKQEKILTQIEVKVFGDDD